ncbi:DUF397 domain-containing protein [Lentzea kentuckyensis]|uniref:DUF397 domain-containing protein n=1 Tax=Lentzea kentuckyensis TaxID=360086 RepID=UPI000A3D1238|nr:DUF397 domain-containing protein [Lentzea kentuckyensis]
MIESTWRKSSYSGQTGDCVEVDGSLLWLRDSKNPDGGRIKLTSGFIAAVKAGSSGLPAD